MAKRISQCDCIVCSYHRAGIHTHGLQNNRAAAARLMAKNELMDGLRAIGIICTAAVLSLYLVFYFVL